MREGLGFFEVRRPRGQEGYPEVIVRESPDELTLGADEVTTWKVIHQCRPHCKGEVESSPGRC